YTLGYIAGDVILYRCRSGIYTSMLTDSPASSKNYEIVFAACTDTDGKNYSIVKIGTQTWMAENLAYLPAVSPSSAISNTTPNYYVYGYEGNSVSSAKGKANYGIYGVLYNWEAGKTACPSGWQLPSDEDWMILEKNLGMSDDEAGYWEFRYSGSVGGKLKETGTLTWSLPNKGATNESGFTALPGGELDYDGGGFKNLGIFANFWSASEMGSLDAWCRGLWSDKDGVERDVTFKGYGFSVRCLKTQAASLPVVSTSEITGIAASYATGGGNIINDGGAFITARGVCWNITGTPTISNDKTTECYKTRAFTSSLNRLTLGTRYFVRAYATNYVGTAYGEQKEFATLTGGDDDIFTDSRDGRGYSYKIIGTQTWMTENLAYLPSVSPSSAGSETTPYYYVYGYEGTSVNIAKFTDILQVGICRQLQNGLL
ncbi:MAG: hypothetical protein NTV01_21740, partial [Bacteroidia bacterium]|nr:hypothetical protein [Bacteroidia bacterium]